MCDDKAGLIERGVIDQASEIRAKVVAMNAVRKALPPFPEGVVLVSRPASAMSICPLSSADRAVPAALTAEASALGRLPWGPRTAGGKFPRACNQSSPHLPRRYPSSQRPRVAQRALAWASGNLLGRATPEAPQRAAIAASQHAPRRGMPTIPPAGTRKAVPSASRTVHALDREERLPPECLD